MDKHVLTNNRIADDKPSLQLFPEQVATQLPSLNYMNRTHRNVKTKNF